MNKAERAFKEDIINKFLAEHDLRDACGKSVKSLDDLNNAERQRNLRRSRWDEIKAILEGYKELTSLNLFQAYSVSAARHLNIERFWQNAALDDYSEEDFELILKYTKAICEGLCVVFPAEKGDNT